MFRIHLIKIPQTTWNVALSCDGCSRAVSSVLMKTPGVESVTCYVATKTVQVTGTASEEVVLAAIQKTGKAVSRA